MATTYAAEHDTEFLETLADFESLVATTVPSERLPSWLRLIHARSETVDRMLRREVKQAHGQIFADTGRRDPHSARRTTELRDSDRQLLDWWGDLHGVLEQLLDDSREGETHTAELKNRYDDYAGSVVDAIQAIQQHEIELTTWFMAASNREFSLACC